MDREFKQLIAEHWQLGKYILYCSDAGELLFTDNETNNERLYGSSSKSKYVKDAFHEYVVGDKRDAVNPGLTGTKAAARYIRNCRRGAKQRHAQHCDLHTRSMAWHWKLLSLTSTARLPVVEKKQMSSMLRYCPSTLRPMHDWSHVRRLPECCGPSSTITTSSLTGLMVTHLSHSLHRNAWTVAIASGPTCSPAMSSACPISGSSPGSHRGTCDFIASPWHTLIRISRSNNSS